MSDPLCGPSNALQSFQKHSSVDRTLQQDRLVSRQSPLQGFRSQDATAGTLDPEFEAFQAGRPGQAPAFAGPSFSTNHSFPLQQSPLHAAPRSASSAAPEWTQAFQQLSLSQPPQEQQRMQDPWNIQFQHAHVHNGRAQFLPPESHVPSPAAHFQPPAFGYRTFQPRNPYTLQAQQPHQESQVRQELPQETFDEAAFEAAFDAAMADANNDQDTAMRDPQEEEEEEEEEEQQNSYKPDKYPHLPLFRLVLAQALIANTNQSLHRAAMIIDLLERHQDIEVTQSVLFRPLLKALTDPNRTLFAKRYRMKERLLRLVDQFEQEGEKAEIRIDPNTEQLLAAYANLLWQRNGSNHLQPSEQPRSADDTTWLHEYWKFNGDEIRIEAARTGDITTRSVDLLTEDFHSQLGFDSGPSSSQPLNRVLELELDAFSRKVTHMGSTKSLDPSENQAALFNLLDTAMSAPETIEALEAHQGIIGYPEQAEANSGQNIEPGDYAMQMLLLAQQNQKRLLLARMEMQRLREQANGMKQEADELEDRVMDTPAIRQDQYPGPSGMHQMADEWASTAQDTSHDQLEEQPTQQQPHDEQHDNELALTAADLLERVADNKTSKFQNSTFLGLMRQLADREVRVEGDKMVPTTASASANAQHNITTNASFSDARQSTAHTQPSNIPKDGQEVVDLLNQPGDIVSDQDPEFMMTSPFATPNDY